MQKVWNDFKSAHPYIDLSSVEDVKTGNLIITMRIPSKNVKLCHIVSLFELNEICDHSALIETVLEIMYEKIKPYE